MLRLFIAIVFILFIHPLIGQDAELDVLAQETCDCIGKKDISSMDQEKVSIELGFCIMESINAKPSDFRDKLNVNITDQAGMQALGEKIGLKMAIKCPEILMAVAGTSTEVETESITTINGTFEGMEGTEFSRVLVKDGNGRVYRLLWFHYFEGSEKLLSAPPAKGTAIRAQFKETEVYSPKVGSYIKIKELKGIEF